MKTTIDTVKRKLLFDILTAEGSPEALEFSDELKALGLYANATEDEIEKADKFLPN